MAGRRTPPTPGCFLEVLILNDFKSLSPELVILKGIKWRFSELVILKELRVKNELARTVRGRILPGRPSPGFGAASEGMRLRGTSKVSTFMVCVSTYTLWLFE
jgi:hypothetical protein